MPIALHAGGVEGGGIGHKTPPSTKGRADIRHIQALLGHTRLSSTERYTHVEITDLKEVVERAHPRGR
jgi:integrase/recombinase XerC